MEKPLPHPDSGQAWRLKLEAIQCLKDVFDCLRGGEDLPDVTAKVRHLEKAITELLPKAPIKDGYGWQGQGSYRKNMARTMSTLDDAETFLAIAQRLIEMCEDLEDPRLRYRVARGILADNGIDEKIYAMSLPKIALNDAFRTLTDD